MKEENLAEVISDKLNVHSDYIHVLNFLDVVADFMALLQAVNDGIANLEMGVIFPELLKVEHHVI
jgi:hypothetical protein